MDARGGGCCVARQARAAAACDVSKMNNIMLRFRPIAPKPVLADPSSYAGVAMIAGDGKSLADRIIVRKKRRYSRVGSESNRVRKRSGGRRRRKSSSEEGDDLAGEMAVKTLPLLPETPDAEKNLSDEGSKEIFPLCLSFANEGKDSTGVFPDDVGHELRRNVSVVRSWVRVECVTEKWAVGGCAYGDVAVGRTDEKKVMDLKLDTCPGLVSDGCNRVIWTNAAYRRMVAGEAEDEVVAVRVVADRVELPVDCAAFTCRVRVVTDGKEKNYVTVPCDVWRMEWGGFAWRLDTKTALSLGW